MGLRNNMKDTILESVNDGLLEASGPLAGIETAETERNKEVSMTYKIKGPQHIINKFEAVFDLVNELSEGKKYSRATIELNIGLGGDSEYSNKVKITKANSRKPLNEYESEGSTERKMNMYI